MILVLTLDIKLSLQFMFFCRMCFGTSDLCQIVLDCLLFCLRGQAEKEFKVEVEAIGRVRHKNLVRLLGYCAEGAHR